MRMTIGVKLGMAFGVCMAVLAAIVFLGYFNLLAISNLQDSGYQRTQNAIAASALAGSGDEMYRVVADAIINRNMEETARNWAEVKQSADDRIANMESVTAEGDQRATLAKIRAAYDEMVSIAEKQLFPLLKPDTDIKQIAAIDANVDEIKRNFTKLVNSIEQNTIKESDKEDRLFDDRMRRLIFQSQLLGLLGAALAAVLAWYISRGIKQALGRSVVFAQAIRAGDMGVRVKVASNDEIGDLCAALNDAADSISQKVTWAEYIARGDYSQTVTLSSEKDTLGNALQAMMGALQRGRDEEQQRDWTKTGLNTLSGLVSGDQKTEVMADRTLLFLSQHLKAGAGAFYLYDENNGTLALIATYALTRRKSLNESFHLGEGLMGQSARERKMICLANVPPDYLPIHSALGEAAPCNVIALPLQYEGNLIGAIELGAFHAFSDLELDFLADAADTIAVALSAAVSRMRINDLLEKSQQQTEELQVQQEELQQSNEELEERAQMLEQQKAQIRNANLKLESAGAELKNKAEALERISTYKSEFLANMSHELRTPLNSMLILSRLLMENQEGTLTPKQQEFSSIINTAGQELLGLINDILDLSKVEAGRIELFEEEVSLRALGDSLESIFRPQADQKQLTLTVALDSDAPETLLADEQRTRQILMNLIGNAIKFTTEGGVTLTVSSSPAEINPLAVNAVAFDVRDTGMGIPDDKQELVFQAFQQADSSTSRRFGGSGLGLSIAQQLARRMGGDIVLKSKPGFGSTFTLFLPTEKDGAERTPKPATPPLPKHAEPSVVPQSALLSAMPAPTADDREKITENDRIMLIIEDDRTFAGILLDMVHERGFVGLVAADGENGIALAQQYRPNGILLDIQLPGTDGWGVMRALKDNPHTRHIPVHFVTCVDDRRRGMAMGAIGYLVKPVIPQQINEAITRLENTMQRGVRNLLIVEDNLIEAESEVHLLEDRDVAISTAHSGADAIRMMAEKSFDCIVLDLGLSDMSGFDLLQHIKDMEEQRRIPVIVHTGRELTEEEKSKLQRYADSVIIKGAKSPDRLLNEVSLFLHVVEDNLPQEKQRMIRAARDREALLEGKKVLLVDDDMRNIFSISAVLQERGMVVVEAENGKAALEMLEEQPDIQLILMDIMMPEMDGYAAMRAMRGDARFSKIPIIAMTAKALKGDREKCLSAGANDYISKPIDSSQLLSMLRVWLYQPNNGLDA